MKTLIISVLTLSLALSLVGCESIQSFSGGPSLADAQLEPYDGPRARVAVAEFEDKTMDSGVYRAEYGRGMSDMLATALFQSGRYTVLEREKLQAVLAEQDFQASGRVRGGARVAQRQMEGADLLVVGAVTGFDPDVSGGRGETDASSLPGGLGGFLSRAAGSVKRAQVAIDLRVLDARTGRIVFAVPVRGTATAFSGETGLSFMDGQLPANLGGYSKTPMEAAMRNVIAEAVRQLVARTPKTYYRHGGAKEGDAS